MSKHDSISSPLIDGATRELSALRTKYRRLTLMVFGALILWLATVLLNFVTSGQAAAPLRYPESLKVRELIVVDANGTPRIRIAAPLPDPIMLGKRSKRGDSASGVLLYDAEGNERGGYVTDGARNVTLTLDEINRAAVHLGVNDRGEMHLALSNGRGGYAAMGVLPSGAWFRLEKLGQPPTILPPVSGGSPTK